MARPKAGTSNISQQVILDTALDILKSEGLDGLSLGAIARSLEIKTQSLYWYFGNRSELLSALSRHLFDLSIVDLHNGPDLRNSLLKFGRSMHQVLMTFPGSTQLIAIAETQSGEGLDLFIQNLAVDQHDPAIIAEKAVAIMSLVLGWATFEANPTICSSMDIRVNRQLTLDKAILAIIDAP